MAQTQFDLHELYQRVALEAKATWRYRWHALIVAWCVAIVGALLVFALPNQYESRTQVYADTGALMNPLLRGLAVRPDVRGQLDIITHTLLSRPNLETVADQTGLSVRATAPADKDELLTELGTAVKIKDAGAKDLYNVSYTDPDPRMAQKVVQAFLQILMNDTLGENSASMQTAQSFLKQQVSDYNARLNAQEKEIADFKSRHPEYFSAQGNNDYFSRVQVAKAELQKLEGEYAGAGTSSGRRSVAQADPEVQQIDRQIALQQHQVENLLLKYTEAYPDVVSARRMIAELKQRRAALLANGGGRSAVVVQDRAGTRMAAGKSLAAEISAKKQEIARLEKSMDQAADVQTALQQLTRNYDITKNQYAELVSRLNTAQLSEAASQSGNNLKFRVVSPPIVPLLPTSPNRGLLLLVVFALAVLIGAAFAFFLHKVRPVFTGLDNLREFGDYHVIGSFDLIVSPALRQRRQREVIGFCTGLGLLALVVVVGFAFNASVANLVQHVFVMGAT